MAFVMSSRVLVKKGSSKRAALRLKPRLRMPKSKSRAGSAYDSHNFAEPASLAQLMAEPLVAELVATPAFRRLAGVRFLGGIDYLLVPTPNGSEGCTRYTRRQHSIGVAWLAMIYARERGLTLSERRLVLAAALLHDIGHCALSHTLEPVFAKQFGLDHHSVTERLVRGEFELGIELSKILQKHGIDLDKLSSLLSGCDDSFDKFFSGPINFDTIEGILRSWAYVQYESRFPAPDAVTLSAIRRQTPEDKKAIDAFWSYKDKVYRYLVRSPRGVIADYLCQEALEADIHRIGPQDFLSTERVLFAKCPSLGALIRSGPSWSSLEWVIQGPIAYQSRHFFIEDGADFFAREDKLRYRQIRESRVILAETAEVLTTRSGDLFGAHRL